MEHFPEGPATGRVQVVCGVHRLLLQGVQDPVLHLLVSGAHRGRYCD